MKKNKSKSSGGIRLEETQALVYLALAVLMLVLNTVLCEFSPLQPLVCGAIMLALYGIICAVIYAIINKKLILQKAEANLSEEQNKSVIYAFRNQLRLPYAVIDEQGKIITANAAFVSAVGVEESIFGSNINELCNIDAQKLIDFFSHRAAFSDYDRFSYEDKPLRSLQSEERIQIGGRKFHLECYPLASKDKIYQMVVFNDITELDAIAEKYRNESTAVGYIVIDNIEEIALYVKVSYQEEARSVGKLLGDWISKLGGILVEYESNKFMFCFPEEKFEECRRNNFAILSEVHKIEIGDAHIPLTVSMGISNTGETLAERAKNAISSLETALQRGGDQVVVKRPDGVFYFGAKTKTVQKNSKRKGRIIYSKLAALVENSSNVLVMGHRNPDFDCIGACIGVTLLIRSNFKDKDVKIVTDVESENFVACTQKLRALARYQNTFIDGVTALEYNSAQTLLIIVDANNMAIVESPELAQNSFKRVFIDHHIKKDEFEVAPELPYIDPDASSACELVAEMLEDALPSDISFNEEATVMLSGIMLDTKNFTRSANQRTFAAALYLQGAHADSEAARTFFEENFDDYLSASLFGSNTKLYRDCIAITSTDALEGAVSRIQAAKAADKLLTIKNVSAAFALVALDGNVNISARSDGSINVQLIAERLGGGGHFDMAGAAINDATIEEAEQRLTQAIDSYFEELSVAEAASADIE